MHVNLLLTRVATPLPPSVEATVTKPGSLMCDDVIVSCKVITWGLSFMPFRYCRRVARLLTNPAQFHCHIVMTLVSLSMFGLGDGFREGRLQDGTLCRRGNDTVQVWDWCCRCAWQKSVVGPLQSKYSLAEGDQTQLGVRDHFLYLREA